MTPVEVVSVWREPLSVIAAEDVAAEGFPDWTPAELVEFLCRTRAGCNRRHRGHAHRVALPRRGT